MALVLAVVALVATVAHFSGVSPGNPLTWAAWLAAVGTYIGSFRVSLGRPPATWRAFISSEIGIALLVLALYLVTHLWNFPSAPWNVNGLFDDAAWDIYFARDHAFNGPFQAAFFDQVGLIARETIFHYYITAFFALFGYNLLVFNAALVVLGFVTVLFTTLIVHRLFGSPLITILAALVINFLPLHYLHVFVGHRYAIAAPLMTVALYFTYSGFLDRSFARVAVAALFSALCLGSAIMGKQFLLAIVVAGLLVPIIERRRWALPETRGLALTWVVGFAIAAIPLLGYVAFNREDYFRRDSGLLSDFVSRFAAEGYEGVRPLVEQLRDLFFAADTFQRLWLHDYPLIPIALWLLLVPGTVIALFRRRVELVLLATIPVGSALLSGPFDFRVLLAAPIWVILMTYTLDALGVGSVDAVRPARGALVTAVAVVVVAAGVIPSASYLWRVSQDPQAQYLLPHRDVAVSRLIQDIVAGDPEPSGDLKADEFRRPMTAAAQATDALVCPERAYAIAHLYVQSFDSRRLLSFCDGGNQALLGPDGVLAANLAAIADYEPGDRALMLIWEESDTAQPAIERFADLERYGSVRVLEGAVDGEQYRVRVLTVRPDSVAAFRNAVLAANAEARP